MDDGQLLDVVGDLYEAALEPGHWPHALEHLRQLLNGGAYAHFLWNKKTGHVPLMHVSGYSAEVCDAYKTYYGALEPGAEFLRRNTHLPLVHDHMWIDDRAMDRDEYHSWLERESGMRYRLGGFVADSETYFGITAVQRSRQQGPAGEHEKRLFSRLLPHIRRATQISRAFSDLQIERQSLIEALHSTHHGILFLDERGRVTFSNRLAETLLAQCDGFFLSRSGSPRANHPVECSELERQIAAAIATTKGSLENAGDTVAITRPSGKRAYRATVIPLKITMVETILSPRAVAAIFINDPEMLRTPPEALLRRICGLTPAESRLAVTLLCTDSLKEAAARLGLTEGSARQTLKRIFSKTNCRSQTALIKLLMSISAP